jgi:DDB1- and CUL4-associated factor 8
MWNVQLQRNRYIIKFGLFVIYNNLLYLIRNFLRLLEIIGSYSDDDIYLFDTSQEESTDAKYRYTGHRNTETSKTLFNLSKRLFRLFFRTFLFFFKVKGVNFYGSNSDYIVTGSDCGRIFLYEKTTQQIVQVLKSDDHGVVNVLEPHPMFPVLATSGLDSDIKIYSPIGEQPNSLENLTEVILTIFSNIIIC